MRRILLAVAIALTCLSSMPLAGIAAQPEKKGTIASEWKETFLQRRGRTTLSSIQKPEPRTHLAKGHHADGGELVAASTYTSPVHEAGQQFNAVGPNWKASVPEGASLQVFVRTSADGAVWRQWTEVEGDHEDGTRDRDGRSFGSLVMGDMSRYAQYRVVTTQAPSGKWPRVSDVTLTYIDSRAGPTAQEAQATTSGAYQTLGVSKPAVISRASWGADEKLRFDSSGKEIWEREYLQVTKAVIHDTITANNDPNPAATVRSIYYYHAVTRGWGDIGYNYLIDEQGRIYEGRVGGNNVVAGHTLCYNWGSVGIAALGDHAKVAPSDAMVRAFERVIAWQFDRQGVAPLGRGIFMAANIHPKGDANNIMAHVDASNMPTAEQRCSNTHVDPGPYLYNRFGEIRKNVAALMGYTPVPKPEITEVTVSPTKLNAGKTARVEVRLRNAGTGLMETQAPYPSTVYAEKETWSARGYAKVPGKYRLLLDRTDDPTGSIGPYRWGIGAALLPGQTRVVTGYVTVPRATSGTWWVGLNQEEVSAVIARQGDTNVSFVSSGAEDTTGGVIRDATVTPSVLSPNGDGKNDSASIQYRVTSAQRVKVELYTASGEWVRTIRGWTAVGTDLQKTALAATYYDYVLRTNRTLPEGSFQLRILAKNDAGTVREAVVPLRIDLTPPSAATVSRTPAFISPNGDGVQDTSRFSSTFSETVNWRIDVRDSAGTLVRTLRGGGTSLSAVWDGRDASGTMVPDGSYAYDLLYSDAAANPGLARRGVTGVDVTRPTVLPATASGTGPYKLTYKLSERSAVAVVVTGPGGRRVDVLRRTYQDAGTRSVSWSGKLADGSTAPPGTYRWSLYATDRAGNNTAYYPTGRLFTVE